MGSNCSTHLVVISDQFIKLMYLDFFFRVTGKHLMMHASLDRNMSWGSPLAIEEKNNDF